MSADPAGVREPAVAGYFYPGDAASLRAEVRRCLQWRPGTPAAGDRPGAAPVPSAPEPAAAVLVPHAGYQYSGRVAGAVYATTVLPRSLVILCPNHTGEGRAIAVMHRGVWRTPLGDAAIDEALADLILEECASAAPDARAHRREHAIEVQLPFLQVRMDAFRFVPICVGTANLVELTRLGHDLSRAIRRSPAGAGIVISSDMSHYIGAEEARAKDMMAVERIRSLDAEGLHDVVMERDISMCGYAPAVAGLTAVRDAGARAARLVAYASSGDASGDFERVVGYAGLAIA